jgi:hypothetical protein
MLISKDFIYIQKKKKQTIKLKDTVGPPAAGSKLD